MNAKLDHERWPVLQAVLKGCGNQQGFRYIAVGMFGRLKKSL
jgi:hypothetical protein